jgi:hypothetical protein
MCKWHKDHKLGRKDRDPVQVRRMMGKRNYSRHEIPS